MRLKRLEMPDEQVLRAFIALKGNAAFERILTYLFDEAEPIIVERLKVEQRPIVVCWDQGAAQTLDDLREISVSAPDWLGKQLLRKQQKEGTTNV